jgi:2-hydroxychromene-2-carboxylate isomerase
MIATAAAITAAVAAGSAAAVASTAGAKPSAPATMSASKNPGGAKSAGSRSAQERRGHDAIAAVVARELHVSTARVSAALRPLFAAGHADGSSRVFAAAARSLGVSTRQLAAALAHGKESLAPSAPAGQSPGGAKAGAKSAGATSAAERRGHDAIVAVVARELHVSTARVSAALRPLFAAGYADTSSPVFAAAARSLGVSTQQLSTALAHGKQSLASGTTAGQSPGAGS